MHFTFYIEKILNYFNAFWKVYIIIFIMIMQIINKNRKAKIFSIEIKKSPFRLNTFKK